MSKIKIIFVLFFFYSSLFAQQKNRYKFDFGTDAAAKGYIAVTPATKYSSTIGYGFINNAEVEAVVRGKKNIITSDFITGSKPFFFSVNLPEGNYNVKIILGDVKGTSATTVRAECRRLFLQNVKTKKGEIKTETFTVHVKDSMIRDKKGNAVDKVKLKSREKTYFHWDNQLTLEFNDTAAKICAVEITPNKTAATVFLAGNSTVVDQDREPWAAWGQMFCSFFTAGNIAVANYAESGETLKAFKGEKRLEKIWSIAKPGDYIFIEFTHNDQKPGSNYLEPFTTYKETLKEWIAEAKKRNMVPVLVTSMHRRNFDSTGHIINTLGDYPKAARQVATETNTAIIDLNAMSKILYETWGPAESVKAFVHYPANTFPGQDKELKDNTHFNTYGAYQLAKCVVMELQKTNLPIVKYLLKPNINFNPAKPDDVTKWYWPLSPLMEAVKPDGN